MEFGIEHIVFRLIVAIIIGGLIGFERGNINSPAGFRTHMLVCLGTTVISLIQVSMASQAIELITINEDLAGVINVDLARLGAQAITGIGFLGAGTIIHSKGAVRGLTSAASLWSVGSLGLAIGMGYYAVAVSATVGIILVLTLLKKFQNKFISNGGECGLEIIFKESVDLEKIYDEITRVYNRNGIKILEMSKDQENDYHITHKLSLPKHINCIETMNQLMMLKGIKLVSKN